jgi:ribosomal-protein-alanine N-acetyltransferase
VFDQGVSGQKNFRIRRLLPEDVRAVREILAESPQAADWSEESIRNSIRSESTLALVGERGGEISGTIFGAKVGQEAEILNLAVKVEFRREGEGSELVRQILGEWAPAGVRRIFLEVRESNLGAIKLYEGLGFRVAGRRKMYYSGPKEDALVLEKSADMGVAAKLRRA